MTPHQDLGDALDDLNPQLTALANSADAFERARIGLHYHAGWKRLANSLLRQRALALADVIGLYSELLEMLFSAKPQMDLSEAEMALLQEWNECCARYLTAPRDEQIIREWLVLLNHLPGQEVAPDEDIEELIESLSVEGAVKPIEFPQFWSRAHCAESLEIVAALADAGTEIHLRDLCDAQHALWGSIADNIQEKGYPIVSELIACYLHQLDCLADRGEILASDEVLDLIQYWHQEFSDFFDAPEIANVTALREILLDPGWPEPLPDGAPLCMEQNVLSSEGEPGDHFEIKPLAERQGKASIDPELLDMVTGEFHRLVEHLGTDPGQVIEACHAEENALLNISRACETIGLSGLASLFRLLRANVARLAGSMRNDEADASLLATALQLIREYLDHRGHDDHRAGLVRHLQLPEWPQPLSETEAPSLLSALEFCLTATGDEIAPPEKLQAVEEDISLRLPEGVNHELYDALLRELPRLTAALSAAIQEASGNHASMAGLQEAQRIAHTLKGACNTIGIQGIANLTHRLEDIFEILTEANVLPDSALAGVLLDAADCLEAMSECVLAESAAPEGALTVLQQVLDWRYRLQSEGTEPHCRVNDNPMAEPQQAGAEQAVVRSAPALSVTIIDEMVLTVGESNNLGERAYDKVTVCLDESREIRDMSWKMNELAADMDRLIHIQTPALRQQQPLHDFDTLEMEQYGELHSNISRLAELTADIRELNARMGRQLMETKNLLQEQRSLHRGQMESIQNMRLAPVQSIVSRCRRIVRQAARMTDKECSLTLSGEQILVDGEMLNELADPLMHMLRNAVDHGIEDAESRARAGKSKEGRIHLSFAKERNFLHIVCQDDGAGLDEAAILRKAIQKGLVEPDEALTAEQIQRLIFRPGFSTKEQSSQVSGRGIGMDIVKNQIALMNGAMELHSVPGQGLRISISLLANLHDARVLLVKHRQHALALAEHGVQQIFASVDGRIVSDNGHYFYQLPDRRYRLESLTRLLNLDESDCIEGPCGAILFRDSNGVETALPVDRIVGSSTLMIRPFGEYLKGVYGVLGGVLLSNGDVAPVIDLSELIGDRERRKLISADEQLTRRRMEVRKTAALVVDDSLSARKLTAQLLSDSGFDVQTAIDGLDAIEKIESRRPEIILVDMEMPRMNGIELSRYLRDDSGLADIPVIMITSRSTDKHRQQAEQAGVDRYFVKPFSEDDLMLEIEALLKGRNSMAA